MTAATLLTEPVWKAEDLGKPLPDSTHAVSMALPRWQDVVDYEEKVPRITGRLESGYPRFVIHHLVQKVASRIANSPHALPFPSGTVARRCASFVRLSSGQPAGVSAQNGVWVVSTNEIGYAALKAFWQHTGLIVSSRQAEAILEGRSGMPEAAEVRQSLRRLLAGWYDCSEDDVFLSPSGMAAQYAALRAVTQRTPNRGTVQLGFPYVDTLKLQQKLGAGGTLLYKLEHIEHDLREALAKEHFAAAFCEVPGNPLLGSADVPRISPILRKAGIPLVADDVVATPVNVDLTPYADLIATSLTKFIVGTGDAMGGALICNPRSPFYSDLKRLVRNEHEELLWHEDVIALETQARKFPVRMEAHNRNGLFIAERLRSHPAVERVWYPKWEFSEAYEAVRRPTGGYGALITFLPKQAPVRSPQIFDRLAICKGPSLGTVFTLACPFTLLAHYTELDWAESCGVSRHLIRLSVGLEPPDELWERIRTGLEAEQ